MTGLFLLGIATPCLLSANGSYAQQNTLKKNSMSRLTISDRNGVILKIVGNDGPILTRNRYAMPFISERIIRPAEHVEEEQYVAPDHLRSEWRHPENRR